MNDDLTTKPTLETLLEMMRDLRDTVNKRFDAVDARFDAMDARFDAVDRRVNGLDIRIDRMDSFVHNTYSEMVAMRADFNELKVQLKEYLPSPK